MCKKCIFEELIPVLKQHQISYYNKRYYSIGSQGPPVPNLVLQQGTLYEGVLYANMYTAIQF